MKQIRNAMLVLIAVVTPLVFYAYLEAINVRVATLKQVDGKVQVQRVETGQWVNGEVGMRLYEGDVLKTGGKSKAVIELDDGSVTQITSLANLKMEKMQRKLSSRQTDLNVELGKSWMKVKKLNEKKDKFDVSTPSAVAGVRGTYFSTEVEQTADSEFDVFEGLIAVSQKGDRSQAVAVASSQRSQVKKGRLPTAAQKIPEEELKEGLSQGIEGAAGSSDDANYDLKIDVQPKTLKAGEKGVVNVQFTENGKPYNGSVIFVLNLQGTSNFSENGSQSIEVTSNEQGFASVEVVAEGEEQIQISADVNFIVEE